MLHLSEWLRVISQVTAHAGDYVEQRDTPPLLVQAGTAIFSNQYGDSSENEN